MKVTAFKENLHSGYSGIVPDPHHIAISLINRIFDFKTQTMIPDFHVDIPAHRKEECRVAAKMLPNMLKMLPANDNLLSIAHAEPADDENYHLIANSTWLPQLTITGLEGLPNNLSDASNSIKRSITLRCSMRLPPTLTAEKAKELLKKHLLEGLNQARDTYGAQVELTSFGDNGFDTKALDEGVQKAFFEANQYVFNGNTPVFVGCGGSIPFMEMFSTMFPKANFLLTGVGFPDSNAHAANENLDLEFCRKLISTVAITLAKL